MSEFNDFMAKVGQIASKAAEKTKDIAAVAATKTKQVSRIAKLNMDISSQKDVVKKAYADLGKLYYEAHHDAPEGDLAPVCQQIDMALASVASMEAEIARIKEEMTADDEAEDAGFEAVVDQTEADVEVEVHEESAGEEPQEERHEEEYHEEHHDDGPYWG